MLSTRYALRAIRRSATIPTPVIRALASAKDNTQSNLQQKASEQKAEDSSATHKSTKKTQAQLDEELRQKMMGLSGDGGEAGIEYEDGQPVAMKRSVKNNMFRYI